MQPAPVRQGSLPDDVYANDDRVDVGGPTGLVVVLTGCVSGDGVGTLGNVAHKL